MSVTHSILMILVLVSSGWLAPSRAQDAPSGYPARPIRIIVPVVPGGGLDIICRSVGQMLTERWGQSVIIDNRGGGGTVLATELAAKAAPDGYTFFVHDIADRRRHEARGIDVARRSNRSPMPQPYILIEPDIAGEEREGLIAYSMNQPLNYAVRRWWPIWAWHFTAQTGENSHVPYKGGYRRSHSGGDIHMYPGLSLGKRRDQDRQGAPPPR
jgi:hypothetical protein